MKPGCVCMLEGHDPHVFRASCCPRSHIGMLHQHFKNINSLVNAVMIIMIITDNDYQ